ncbi:MAG: hypothetical protein AAGD96_22530 [Chloroflexota bacterium]
MTDSDSTLPLEIKVTEDGIHIYKLADWSNSGLKAWEESLVNRLDNLEDDEISLSIYDMRHLTTVSKQGFDVANRLDTHPRSSRSYSVAVLSSRRLAILVDTLIKMRRHSGRNRIFSDIDEALAWLRQKKSNREQGVITND